MEQYVKGFQRFHAGEDVRPVTSALASFYHLFQVYYKVRQMLLQSATAFFYYKVRWSVITKCDSFFITKCDKCCYKVRQVLQSVTILLQSATGTYIHTYVYLPLPQRGFSVPITKKRIKIKTYTNYLKSQLQIIRISFLPLKFV